MTSASDILRADIREHFGSDLEDDLVLECECSRAVVSANGVSLPTAHFLGVKLCQANNLSGESLFYKWEATRFNRGPTSQFTLEDVQDVRAQIQREARKRVDIAKKFTRGSLSGPQSRGFATSSSRAGRPHLSSSINTPVKSAVRPQDGFNMSSRVAKKATAAGPSRVAVVPQPTDETARQKPSCECFFGLLSGIAVLGGRGRSLYVRKGLGAQRK